MEDGPGPRPGLRPAEALTVSLAPKAAHRRVWFFSPWLSIGTWRSEWPAADLERRGWNVKLVDQHSPAGLRERVEQALEPTDVVILHVSNMIRSGLTGFVEDLRRRVGYVIVQFDDDYTAHKDVQIVRDTQLLDDVIGGIKAASGLVAATQGVADAYSRWAPWTKIIPNRMPAHAGTMHWTGLHLREAVYMAILGPMDSDGVDPHYLDAMTVADLIADRPLYVLGGTEGSQEVFPHCRYSGRAYDPDIRWPRRSVGRLYRTLAKHRVSIAPLRDTKWNRAKSWIKPLEAATVGVPTVCSDLPEYRRLAAAGVPVAIATEPDQWGKLLDYYLGLEESEWRLWSKTLRTQAATQAIERHDEWEQLLTGL